MKLFKKDNINKLRIDEIKKLIKSLLLNDSMTSKLLSLNSDRLDLIEKRLDKIEKEQKCQ